MISTSVELHAPGHPGIPPRWTSSAKSGVGTALQDASRVWFTLSHGIVNEIYYSRIDQACSRDLGCIVTDGHAFFSEEKRHTFSQVTYLAAGVPAYRVVNTCTQGRYRIEKEIVCDPQRDVVLQHIQFVALQGQCTDYHIHTLLAPHLGNHGTDNTAWVGDYKGVPMLFAERDGLALALACSAPWKQRSVGFVGFSDGWQDLCQHKRMTWTYTRAAHGNVALTGELDLQAGEGGFVLALGFGRSAAEAGHRALASLQDGFTPARSGYVQEWQTWQRSLHSFDTATVGEHNQYRISTAVLRSHEDKRFSGGLIASLSIPWGFAKGDEDLGGYHLVWPRDLVEAAGGLLAAGAWEDARRILSYLQVTQETDGHWPQNMWMDGTPYWNGVQMDETALPILLVDQARREGALATDDLSRFWPMVRRAASYLVRNGPVTQQDRWEMDPGYSPFTLAAETAALVVAADLADMAKEAEVAIYLRETADTWNANIERWTYVTASDLGDQLGIAGHYVRIAPPEEAEAASPQQGFVPIKGRSPEQQTGLATEIIGPDPLALVRFGLRAPDDLRIIDTVKVIDAVLKVEMPQGPAWRRYSGDRYGEHVDGGPFDGRGRGRAWPLLTGERAHYELAVGHKKKAERLRRTLAAFANDGGLIPEQIWDAADIPERELFCGRPSGSAMPLVWAHAEYVKLCRSLCDGRVFDTPPQTVQRYVVEATGSPFTCWRFNHKCRTLPAGTILRLEVLAPALVHWSADGWQTTHDSATCDTTLGVHVVDLPTATLPIGSGVDFTFYWRPDDRWEHTDFTVRVE